MSCLPLSTSCEWNQYKQIVSLSDGLGQCPGRLLGLMSQNPSVSKSNQLHVVIFQGFFLNKIKSV